MAWNEPGPGKKDPWNSNGGRPQQGGPDLDEMLKRFKERLAGRGNGNGGKPTAPAGPTKGMWGGALLLIAALWTLSGFYTVDEQERAVVFRFGAYAATTEPGLRWHLPWPIERHEKVKFTGVRTASARETILTKDENIIDVDLSVQYRVVSAYDFLMSLDDPDLTLSQSTKAAVREVVGQNSMDTILTDGRQAISTRIKQLLQARLNQYKAGIQVNEVNLRQVQPPEAVQAAFADAIKAREDQERQKNEAEAYAFDKLPKARGAAARELAEGAAYRDQIVARAEGDASRFKQVVEQYKKAPGVTRDRMYLDAMSEVYGRSNKILLDVDKGSPMIYLPLEQLMKAQPKASETYAEPPAATASPTPPASPDSRSRDRNSR